MKVPLTKTFRGLMYPAIQGGAGVNEGTKVFERKSGVPALRGDTRMLDRATAMISSTPMAVEIDAFVKDLSVGKKGFNYQKTYIPVDKQEMVVIVDFFWDEEDVPVAPSALPSQATASATQAAAEIVDGIPMVRIESRD